MGHSSEHRSSRSQREQSSKTGSSSRISLRRLWPSRWFRGSTRRRRRRVSRWVTAVVFWPIGMAQGLFWRIFDALGYLWGWFARRWRQREWRYLLQGLPALLGFLLVVLVAVLAYHRQTRLVDVYRQSAVRALQAENYSSARIYYERLIVLNQRDESTRYDLALALAGLGQTERASTIMESMAPLDRAGYGQAHLWLATRILGDFDPNALTVAHMQRAFAHLTHAKQRLPNAAEVDWYFARYHAASGRPEAAVPHLENAVNGLPELYFELSLLYATLGQMDAARQAAHRAHAHLRGWVSANPNDDDARLRWASVRVNLGDFEGAIRILTEGAMLRPDGPFQQALARALISRFDQISQQSEQVGPEKIELLRMALRHDPNSQEALVRLIDLGGGSAEERQDAREMLQGLLVGGYATPFIHFVLGCRAWEAGTQETALFHLERAYQLDEQLAPVANNLAWVLAHRDPPDLDRALAIINSVLDRWPNDGNYRDTRGQILVKLERWNEALDDLERALPQMPSNVALHQALAVAYRNLGQEPLAEKHEELAQYLVESGQK